MSGLARSKGAGARQRARPPHCQQGQAVRVVTPNSAAISLPTVTSFQGAGGAPPAADREADPP